MEKQYTWINPQLEVRNAGGGDYKAVFAKERISAGVRLAIFGGKLIRAVEEVGDYGLQIDETFVINALDPETQESDDGFFFNLCGKDNCRKIVTDDDWKLPELQQKYNGFFSWYLQEKIDKLYET